MPSKPSRRGTAIRIAPGVKGTKLINLRLGGATGVDVGAGSDLEMRDVTVEADVGIRAGPRAKIALVGVRFEAALADIVQHATTDTSFVDTAIRKLKIIADNPQLPVPKAVRDDLERAVEARTRRARLAAAGRAIRALQTLDWLTTRGAELLGRLLDALRLP